MPLCGIRERLSLSLTPFPGKLSFSKPTMYSYTLPAPHGSPKHARIPKVPCVPYGLLCTVACHHYEYIRAARVASLPRSTTTNQQVLLDKPATPCEEASKFGHAARDWPSLAARRLREAIFSPPPCLTRRFPPPSPPTKHPGAERSEESRQGFVWLARAALTCLRRRP